MKKHDSTASRFRTTLRTATYAVSLIASVMPAFAANLTRSIEVSGAAADVWSVIGPFCAIKDWLPPVGQCIEDGKSPPTRTLVTRDGKASFVESQTARDDGGYSYSYAFLSSPLPVSQYKSTIKVTATGEGMSLVTWTGVYTPESGKEKEAVDALSAVYDSGLAAIKDRFKR